MVSNKWVMQSFLRLSPANSRSLHSRGDKLFTYSTCLAEWKGNILYVNVTSYSATSSKHKTQFLSLIPRHIRVIQIQDVPKYSQSLPKDNEHTV